MKLNRNIAKGRDFFMKKKCIPFILALVLGVLSILAGACSKSGETDNSSAPASDRPSGNKVELTISAAASLQDAFKEIQEKFEKEQPGIKLSFNYGASGALQKQIEQGAAADLFFSADEDKFDQLQEKGLLDPAKSKKLLANELVLVVPKGAKIKPASLQDLTKEDIKQIAIGTPESVPAGAYAKEALTDQHVWDKIQAKLVMGKDVRQVLSYVETGNVEAGLVYLTDAKSSDKVEVAVTASEDSHTPIIYPAGMAKETKHAKEADLFLQYTQGKEAKEIFTKYGFKVQG
ncbi:molybdate-binding lipoprotein-like protein [Paenibacillus larvae subsp. larvae DSM 25430]|uniref:Molybdate-binding lipoprotein-like protein n=2 Tax=Paenibacillus larvae subsp. larvae TaxID=147375 RepID=V9W849_9BACL|nr:molybdate-binding lipoprotein-like protein [Paenibacillus larvae subsp. larvae DSM 25430]